MGKRKEKVQQSASLHKKAAFYGVYAVLFFLAVETGFRLAEPWLITRMGNWDSAETRRWSFVARYRENPEGYRTNTRFVRFDPELGWAHEANVREFRQPADFGMTLVSTNARGLRGHRDFDYEKKPKTLRVEIFGDSFTFGAGVSDSETFAAKIQDAMPEAEIMNFGVSGYGHDQMLRYFELEGVKYKPDVVVLGFASCDMVRNVSHFRDFAKPMFEISGSRMELAHVPVPSPREVFERDFFIPRWLDMIGIFRFIFESESEERQLRIESVTSRILEAFALKVRNAGARPVFVYFPVFGEIQDFKRRPRDVAAENGFFLPLCSRLKADCFSLWTDFEKAMARGEKLAPPEAHWSAVEHAIAAKKITSFLNTGRVPAVAAP